jgi:TatA/E family protein of Tat protein translocase
LLLFGPRRLPEIGRTIGKGLAEFRKATTEFKTSLEREVDVSELKRTRADLDRTRADVLDTLSGVGPRGGAVARAEGPLPGRETTGSEGDAPAPRGADLPPSDAPDEAQR